MSQEECTPIAEAKDNGEPARAPLRLMTQFLRAVSESRMEDALALAQTILTFEPQNAIILDYQATLAQYINNAREEDANSDDDEGASCSGEEPSSASAGSGASNEDVSTEEEEASGGESSEGDRGTAVAAPSNGSAHGRREKELRQLGGVLRNLRETRVAGTQEVAARWDEEKFAAPRREVEQVLWRFLPEEAKQAAQKRAEDDASERQQHSVAHT